MVDTQNRSADARGSSGRESEGGGLRPSIGDMSGWLVEPERVRVWEDDHRLLHVSIDGEEYEDVYPRRVFPLSGKADYVSFMDSGGDEVVLLAHPAKLDRKSRRVLRHVMERTYFAAQILQVYEIKETMGVSSWKVRTDRGFAQFEVVDRNQHIRLLPPARYMITDADGNRFVIEDLRRLDKRSRAEVYHET